MTDGEWLERMRDIYAGDPYMRKGRVKRWWNRFSDWLVANL